MQLNNYFNNISGEGDTYFIFCYCMFSFLEYSLEQLCQEVAKLKDTNMNIAMKDDLI
jgi:hypothetical protein